MDAVTQEKGKEIENGGVVDENGLMVMGYSLRKKRCKFSDSLE